MKKEKGRSEQVIQLFDSLDADGRQEVALDLCKRYPSLICCMIEQLDKCVCKKVMLGRFRR